MSKQRLPSQLVFYKRIKMNTYSVVEFTENNSLKAVPTNWLKKNKCAWPITKNYSTIRKLIERKSVSNEIEYTYFNAKVLKTTAKIFKTIMYTFMGDMNINIIGNELENNEYLDMQSSNNFCH